MVSPINYQLNIADPANRVLAGAAQGQGLIQQAEQRGIAQDANMRAQAAEQRSAEMHPLQMQAVQVGIDQAQQRLDAAREQQARRDQFQQQWADIVGLGTQATFEDFAALNAQFPELAQGTMEFYDALDENRQRPLVSTLAQAATAIKNGDVETGIELARDLEEAAKASGDVQLGAMVEAAVKLAEANPDAAFAQIGTLLHHVEPDLAKRVLGTDVEGRVQRTSPIGDGTVLVQTFRDGSTKVVDAVTNQVLTGKEADDAVERALGRKTSQVGAEAGARTRATKEAEAAVEREQSAPEDIARAKDSIALIEAVRDDPNLAGVTGIVQGRLPARTQAQQDLLTRIGQIQGQAFLQAFQSLKGGGQITEREGEAATRAIARLERAQSDTAFKEALNDLIAILDRPLKRAQEVMGEEVSEDPNKPLIDLADRMADPNYIPTQADLRLLGVSE